MAAETLKEYLVSLGFSVDSSSLQKWGAALGSTAGTVVGFAAVVTAAAAATEVFVGKVTKNLSDLYWASQRIGSSVTNIQSFGLAIQKLGGTSEGAQAALENISRLIRTNPATESIIHALGVQTRDANGELLDTTIFMRDLAKRFAEMKKSGQYWQAARWAEMLGIDETTLFAMTRGLAKFGDEYAKFFKQAGIDPKAAAAAAMDFQNRISDLHAEFSVLETELGLRLMPVANQFLDWLLKASKPGGDLDQIFKDIGNAAPHVQEAALGLLKLADTALNVIAAMPSEALELGIVGYFLFGKKGAAALGIIGAANALLGKMQQVTTSASGSHALKDKVAKGREKEAGTSNEYAAYRWMIEHGLGSFTPPEFQATYAAFKKQGAKGDTSGQAGKNRGLTADAAISFFQKAGWTASQAAGIVANLMRESKLKLNATGDSGRAFGVAQWHADRQAAFKAWAGHDIRNSTVGEQLAFVNYELTRGAERAAGRLLRGAGSAVQAGQVVSLFYERPGLANAEAQMRGALAARLGVSRNGGPTNVSISQKNDFHISGSGSPTETAHRIGTELRRTTGDLVRNMKGAVQ